MFVFMLNAHGLAQVTRNSLIFRGMLKSIHVFKSAAVVGFLFTVVSILYMQLGAASFPSVRSRVEGGAALEF